MNLLTWDKKSFIIDGKRGFLRSGEFHYFRVPKKDWKRRLDLFKKAGGNCVATYVPWCLHEPEEGKFLFGDCDERDVETFFKLCKDAGLYVQCRPGPYVYSELYCHGLPRWLCENYQEILARNAKGEIFQYQSISYLHPRFLAKVANWYDKVVPIINKYSVDNGGPIALAQVDNELMGIHEWFGSLDYNRASMGIGVRNGRYPEFLKKRYGRIGFLNKAYSAKFADFHKVMPLPEISQKTVEDRRRVKDYQDFYFQSCAEYLAILSIMLRKRGVKLPITHNSGNPSMNSYFHETIGYTGSKEFILGSDHYYNLSQDWDQNNPTPKYAGKCFYSNEMLRLYGFPPTIFELPGGSQAAWPHPLPEDMNCAYMLNVAFGMKGFNYYVYTGGPDNPQNISYKNNYDYNAFVSGDGKIRPTFKMMEGFHKFLIRNRWLAEAELVSDFQIGLDWEQTRSHHYFSSRGDFLFGNNEAWQFLQKGITMTALNNSYTPGFSDLYSDAILREKSKPLFVPTSACMAEHVQERLVKFVKSGGRLIIAPVIPYLDENFNPCTVLSKFLGGARSEAGTSPKVIAPAFKIGQTLMRDKYFVFTAVPRNAEIIARAQDKEAVVGFKNKVGKGTVVALGYQWHHSYDEHSNVFRHLLELAGAGRTVVTCDNPNIWAVVRSDGKRSMLFVMNLFASPQKANVLVRGKAGKIRIAKSFRLAPMAVETVMI